MNLKEVDVKALDLIGQAAIDMIGQSLKTIVNNHVDESALSTAIALTIVCAFAEKDVLNYAIKDTDAVVAHLMVQLRDMLQSQFEFIRAHTKDDVVH